MVDCLIGGSWLSFFGTEMGVTVTRRANDIDAQ